MQLCVFEPSMAQQRLLKHLTEKASGLARSTTGLAVGGLDNLRKYLRTDASNYGSITSVLPVSGRCAVPERAATVDTSAVLREFFPSLSLKASDPEQMIGSSPAFVDEPPRVTCLLGADTWTIFQELGLLRTLGWSLEERPATEAASLRASP